MRFLFSDKAPNQTAHEWLSALDRGVLAPHFRRLVESDDDNMGAFDELLASSSEGGRLAGLELTVFAGKSGSPNHVNLMNIHTAKGTEFNAVVIVGVDECRLPIYRARTPAELGEQRRLFFVGLSRARREVHLLYSGFTENQYGRRFEDGPSRFLIELQSAPQSPPSI